MALYTKTYPRFPTPINVRGFEIPIPLPVEPPLKEFRNYGKTANKQFFERDPAPKNIMTWDALKRDNFIAEQWHKRKNGEWWLIKGQKVYLTGTAWFFFNHWEVKSGGRPKFRIEAVEWFLVWDYILNDPNCLGMFDLKPRRVGDTEKALCAGYELVTRYRNSDFGMQNFNREEAVKNFGRVVNAHKKMPIWFKPINLGSDDPKKDLVFKYPPKHITAKGIAEKDDSEEEEVEEVTQELNSSVSQRPTTLRSYDGQALRYYHLDEPIKILPKDMNVTMQWEIVQLCLTKYNANTIVGKAVFTSSSEDVANGETVKIGRELWNGADVNNKSSLGRTVNGLYRYFRDYVLSSEPDEYGFYDEEKAKEERDIKISALIRDGLFQEVANFKRRFPASVEEALAVPEKDCILFPHLLDMQMQRLEDYKLQNKLNENNDYPVAQRGNFVWTKGFKSEVKFVPDDANGKFWVSGHPEVPNNWRISGGAVLPGNMGILTMGVDGVDHARSSAKGGGSDFAISVFRLFDNSVENKLEWIDGEHGAEIVNKWAMRTGRFVCTYSYKAMRPEESWEDCLKCALYYGVPAFIERDKPGAIRYFQAHGFGAFCATMSRDMKGHYASKDVDAGAKQTVQLINQWIPELQMHVADFSETYVHQHQLAVFRNFTGDNRGECDLVVSSGMALLDARKYRWRAAREEKKQEWVFPFETVPLQNYN